MPCLLGTRMAQRRNAADNEGNEWSGLSRDQANDMHVYYEVDTRNTFSHSEWMRNSVLHDITMKA